MNPQNQPKSLAEAIALSPESLASLMIVGHSFYQQGRLAEALDIFEGLVLLDSSNPYAHAILGSIHQQQKQLERAIECYSRAISLYPTDINSLANRGECYLHLGQLQESARDLKAAILLNAEGNNPAANRARFLSKVTLEALKLAETGGREAVLEAKRRFDEQLSKP